MALAKVGLGSITQVAAATTTAVYTVGSQKLFTSGFEIHSLDASNVANVQVHVVPAFWW